MPRTSIFDMPFSKVYDALVKKAEKKGRTKADVDEITRWLTGYSDLNLCYAGGDDPRSDDKKVRQVNELAKGRAMEKIKR